VGYAGGTIGDPAYRAMGDHTECFQVDFDPQRISYEELLDLFWQSHDPTHEWWKVQYASLVLAHTPEQLETAKASAALYEQLLGKPIVTRIEMLDRFWPAENYHQKYHLRQDRVLAAEFQAMFDGDEMAFRESTAAAHVNGYVAGDGTAQQLATEIDLLGLSEVGQANLSSVVSRSGDGIGCSIG
jgi:methionine-S-sulfoxide reductase